VQPTKTPSSTSVTVEITSSEARRRRVMVLLWARMSAMFPQWESLYGNVDGPAIAAWTKNLGEFTEAELGGAIKAAERYEGKFLPSYPEFRAMCAASRASLKSAADTQRLLDERKAEPTSIMGHLASHATSEAAKAGLANLEAILSGDEVETFEQSYANCGCQRRFGHMRAARF